MARGELYAKFSRKFGQLVFGGRSGHLGSCGFSGGCRITIPKISWRFAEIALAPLAKLAREATPYLLSRAVFQCRPTGAPMRTPPTSAAFSSYRSGVVRQRSCFNHNVFTSNSAHLRPCLLATRASAHARRPVELARGAWHTLCHTTRRAKRPTVTHTYSHTQLRTFQFGGDRSRRLWPTLAHIGRPMCAYTAQCSPEQCEPAAHPLLPAGPPLTPVAGRPATHPLLQVGPPMCELTAQCTPVQCSGVQCAVGSHTGPGRPHAQSDRTERLMSICPHVSPRMPVH